MYVHLLINLLVLLTRLRDLDVMIILLSNSMLNHKKGIYM